MKMIPQTFLKFYYILQILQALELGIQQPRNLADLGSHSSFHAWIAQHLQGEIEREKRTGRKMKL